MKTLNPNIMKTYKKIIYGLLAIVFLASAQCEKDHLDKYGLPKETQTGANTLGFLLNGEPWYPKGMVGLSSNLSMDANTTDNSNGRFNIASYRYMSETKERTDFGIGITRDLNTYSAPFSLPITNDGDAWIRFIDSKGNVFRSAQGTFILGTLNITRKGESVIAGTFDAVLHKAGLDTIKITNGRFDMIF